MKKMKRLAAFLLAMVMVLAMSMPAMAATITVPDEVQGDQNNTKETYTAYKIFDVTTVKDADGKVTGWAYTLDASSSWVDALTDTTQTWFKLEKSVDGSVYNVSWNDKETTDEEKEVAAKAAAAYLLTKKPDNVTGKTLVTGDNNVEDGYYLITSSLGSNLALATTDIPINITEKNTYPTEDKKIVEDNQKLTVNNYSIGDTIDFELIANIPDEANQKLVLHDTMSEGLTLVKNSFILSGSNGTDTPVSFNENDYTIVYKKDLTVVTASPEITDAITATEDTTSQITDTDTFEITFTDNFVKNLNKDTTITIKYQAVLNDQAVIEGAGNTNKLKLTYSNYTTPEITNTIYTYGFDLVKYYKEDNDNHLLEGAKFKLYKENQVDENGKLKENATPINFNTTKSTYKVDDAIQEAQTVSELVSVSSGALKIQGLDAGVYYLEETEAPNGYNGLSALVKIQVEATNDDNSNTLNGQSKVGSVLGQTFNGTVSYGDITTGTSTVTITDGKYTSGGVGILNNAGTVLPSTGGMGTTIFYIVGGILVVGAGVLLVTRKRMDGQKK